MSDLARIVLQSAVTFTLIAAFGGLASKARARGRGQWLTVVGRPPRDLYADRRVNFFANLIHEWSWIGFCVMMAGFVMLFPGETRGFAVYVLGLGIAMMIVRAIGTPLCLTYAKLAPQYEAQAAAAVAAKAA